MHARQHCTASEEGITTQGWGQQRLSIWYAAFKAFRAGDVAAPSCDVAAPAAAPPPAVSSCKIDFARARARTPWSGPPSTAQHRFHSGLMISTQFTVIFAVDFSDAVPTNMLLVHALTGPATNPYRSPRERRSLVLLAQPARLWTRHEHAPR